MGRDRRPQGDRWVLGRFDLRGEADEFAAELTELLNRTVTDGIRIIAITDKAARQARIGYGITPSGLDDPKLLPLAFGGKAPRLYLGLLFMMAADDRGQWLAACRRSDAHERPSTAPARRDGDSLPGSARPGSNAGCHPRRGGPGRGSPCPR